MASAARIAANQLNAQESTEPRTSRSTAADAAEPVAASNRGALQYRAPDRRGGDPAKIVHWDSRPDLSNEIRGRGSAKSQFHATGSHSSLV
jgi:hypothetical protein